MSQRRTGIVLAAAALVALAGCENKTTRKVTVETPNKKTEVKVETTEKKKESRD